VNIRTLKKVIEDTDEFEMSAASFNFGISERSASSIP
jgi:hypothetical protein